MSWPLPTSGPLLGADEDPLGALLDHTPSQEETDWTMDLLSAVQPPRPAPDSAPPTLTKLFLPQYNKAESTLNTPTVEYSQEFLVPVVAAPPPATSGYPAPSTSGTYTTALPFKDTDFIYPTSCSPEQGFESVWGTGFDSPTILEGVPLSLVEGKMGGRMEEGEEEEEMITPKEEPLTPAMDTSTDLLNWLVNDTINEHSEIPGEVKEEEVKEIPTTLDTTPLFQDFSYSSGEPFNRLVPTSPPSPLPTGGGPVRGRKRGRGRPPLPHGRPITPRVKRSGRPSSGEEDHHYASTDGELTEAELQDLRYRRMRDLNNEASKRCRENRKNKFERLEAECEELKQRNLQLKARFRRLEVAVRRLKTVYLASIAAGGDLPDVAQMWSTLDADHFDFKAKLN